jgi:hypothetical protein
MMDSGALGLRKGQRKGRGEQKEGGQSGHGPLGSFTRASRAGEKHLLLRKDGNSLWPNAGIVEEADQEKGKSMISTLFSLTRHLFLDRETTHQLTPFTANFSISSTPACNPKRTHHQVS